MILCIMAAHICIVTCCLMWVGLSYLHATNQNYVLVMIALLYAVSDMGCMAMVWTCAFVSRHCDDGDCCNERRPDIPMAGGQAGRWRGS